jgi:glyoxylase-like metal-dependent hydrolase (beta-lactamase superfamily II)
MAIALENWRYKNMLKFSIVVLALLAPYSWADGPQDPAGVIRGAAQALGSDSLKTIQFSGSGYDFAIGQAPNPSSPWPKFNDKTYSRAIDFEAPATSMQRVRTQAENPPRGGGLQPIIGDQQQSEAVPAGSPQAATLADDLMMLVPYSFLRSAAAAKDTKVIAETAGGKRYTVLTFTGSNKAAVRGYLNDHNILEKVETKIDNPVLGDIPFQTAFTGYRDFGGLQFPTHIVQKQGGYSVLDLTITEVKPNTAVNIGPSRAPAPPPAAAASPSEKLGDGVYVMPARYTALAVDFKEYIVVIEGPQNDERAGEAIAEAKKLIPNKTIKYVINTHSHFDHAGGLRAFVAEGATVVTQEINIPYYKKVWANPHAIHPDRLAQNPKKATFKAVTDKLTLSDGDHIIELYHLQNFLHNDGMLIAYLPKEKVLVEADGFNPPAQLLTKTPATVSPYTASLLENVERLKLDVKKIISIHYPADKRDVTMAELRTAAGKAN